MYRKKYSLYRIQYYPQFQASTGDLGTDPTCIWPGKEGVGSVLGQWLIFLGAHRVGTGIL